uniref:guanine nucleotide-binding protein-like 1 isoform X2 n=1 Tax=Arvicanthis niloticus TaxID=61156 RepID=UPI001486DD3E|nr:guanine nucleotide-binding protein-like 1 isoform X2 [Arvicanthis niloticus]
MPRKKPFSVKQKKKQLQDKRERKRGLQDGLRSSSNSRSGSRERREEQTDTSDGESVTHHIRRLNQQPSQGLGPRGYDPNRYRLHFERDSREEVERRKRAAREQVLQPVSAEVLELDIREVYQPGSVLDFPRRPPWSYEMSKEQLMSQEERSFQEYLGKIHGAYTAEKLSYFEHNLETWRQLWRVLEMSDIVLLITDIRHPVVNFPPALYEYVTGELGLALVLVLNKVDLAPPALVVAWKHYFHQHYPQLHIVLFTSFPRDTRTPQGPGSVLKKNRRRGRGWTRALGPEQLLKACEAITMGKVDLSSWREKIARDVAGASWGNASGEEEEEEDGPAVLVEQQTDSAMEPTGPSRERYKDGVVTIGCVGSCRFWLESTLLPRSRSPTLPWATWLPESLCRPCCTCATQRLRTLQLSTPGVPGTSAKLGQRNVVIKQPRQLEMMCTEQPTASFGWQWMAASACVSTLLATANREAPGSLMQRRQSWCCHRARWGRLVMKKRRRRRN